MFSTLVKTALLVSLAVRQAVADLEVPTFDLVQCKQTNITYSKGEAMYALYVVPSEDPCADSIIDLPDQPDEKYLWKKVNLPAGAMVQLVVVDSSGTEGWSGVMTVRDSDDDSCVSQEATAALKAANSFATNTTASALSATDSPAPTPNAYNPPAVTDPLAGAPQSVQPDASPASASGLANAANPDLSPLNSSSIPRAILPTGSLLGVVAFLLALAHF